MPIDIYKYNVYNVFNSNNIVQINNDPTENFQIDIQLKKYIFTDNIKRQLKKMNPQAPIGTP